MTTSSDLELDADSEPRVTTLVAGIIGDAQELIRQQLAMFKQEVRSDFRKTREAGKLLGIGLVLALPACVLLCAMLVHLLHWTAPQIPLWGCFGIVGAALSLLAAAFLVVGARQLKAFNPLPDQSVDALKENVRWLKNPK